MCNDFRAHEPRNIEFHQQNRRTFAKIEFGDLKTFFLPGFYTQLTEVCWDLDGDAPKLRSRCHFAPR